MACVMVPAGSRGASVTWCSSARGAVCVQCVWFKRHRDRSGNRSGTVVLFQAKRWLYEPFRDNRVIDVRVSPPRWAGGQDCTLFI
jgi:hypothetical protein